ncbi:MAG TPA: hypothetical protein PK513_01535 [Alphaproteobacteria bacterium]|mgnify:CR=1 FL=1|nr:hypothetical protein [Alphaproteobacteria bacterium]USO05964.1 MAG: hypothetical protein H6859_01805 [Rhodospirillales bacterium]HOO81165.1 hypothetical protein [Alphaproteobacteria bacterium]
MTTEKTFDNYTIFTGIGIHIQFREAGATIETVNARDLEEELKIAQTEGTQDPNYPLKRQALTECQAIRGF